MFASRSVYVCEPQQLVVSCQLLVGAKHLEDKLSVIAKNSSPNASPVQLSVAKDIFSLLPAP
ncbi:MAG: hypothetical protein HEQ33_10090 [Dolichospermum sp. WA123]|nr:hypothetical protein [Dolichospermum sp. WA123]